MSSPSETYRQEFDAAPAHPNRVQQLAHYLRFLANKLDVRGGDSLLAAADLLERQQRDLLTASERIATQAAHLALLAEKQSHVCELSIDMTGRCMVCGNRRE